MTTAINPYCAPEYDTTPFQAQYAGGNQFNGLWRDGKLLVLTKGVELPNICLKTNEPTDGSRIEQRFTWTPGWVLAIIGLILVLYLPLGMFLCLVLGPFVTHRAKIRYPASSALYRRWQQSRRIGWNAAAVVAVALVGTYMATNQDRAPIAVLLLLFAGLVVVVACVARAIVGWRLKAKRISKHYIWLKDVHPDYLSRLPEIPLRI